MSYSIACTQCNATLKYKEELFGKTLNCPRCQTPATLPFPEVAAFDEEEVLEMADVVEEETPAASPSPSSTGVTASATKAKKKKKKKAKKAGWEMPAIAVEPIVWQGLFGILGVGLFIFAIWYLMQWPQAKPLDAGLWQEHIEAPYFKVKLPGTAKKEQQNQAGITMHVLNAMPHKECIFGVAYSTGWLPPGRLEAGANVILNDACSGAAANLEQMGAEEVDRKSIKHKNFPGKQLTMKIREKKGYMILRGYLVGSRLYMVMVGGKAMDEKHPDIVKFFDSFEIIEEPGKPAEEKKPAEEQRGAGKTEVPATPQKAEPTTPPPPSDSAKEKKEPGKTSPSQSPPSGGQASSNTPPPVIPEFPKAPYDVDPAIKPGLSSLFLSDMQEFNVSRSPSSWAFGKKGVLNSPIANERIKYNGKHYEKGLSTHPEMPSTRYCVYYAVGGKATRLRGSVALDDTGYRSQGYFAIVGDGKTLWDSRSKIEAGVSEAFDVDLTGVKVLSIQCWCEKIIHGCHCVWLDPELTLVPGKK